MHLQEAKKALRKVFGYKQFLPMQEEIIEAVFQKKDALVLMPTGGGKSICYQIPAITMEGVTIVVSPLISLMKDQVEALRANGVAASYLNSSQTIAEQKATEEALFHSQIDLCYVSPEKLVSSNFLPLLQSANINLFAIDEAHCISSWGHDFRPEYTKMKFLKAEFKNIPVIALTATADRLTRKDIVGQLQLDNPEIFVASFDRPNLSLKVRPGQKRLEQILEFLQQHQGQAGIIYCLSRKSTENLANKLSDRAYKAQAYHAGLSSARRNRVQEDFLNDNVQIICATIAFGMGIDKSNVRWIIHYNLPKNIESYYQEIGRAGRDGSSADTMLFYSYGDVMILKDILESEESDLTEIKLAKLDRMRQYAESLMCRRRILLNYFSENYQENCGNCDICKNPPQYFDGTTIAQKALSAIYRLRGSVGMRMLVDVLRGSGRREIFERGYQKIKTYGAGRDIPAFDWQNYLLQLLNLGYIEIAHEKNNVVRLTAASQTVLFDGEKVQLVKSTTVKERKEKEKARTRKKTQKERVRDELFEELRQVRKKLARQRGVPPYIIFSDATLEEMAAHRPVTDAEMKTISGVGERKLQLYGDAFMETIRNFISGKSAEGMRIKGSTYIHTFQLYKQGKSVEEIAQHRSMNPITIYSHLAYLYEKGEPIDLAKYITKEEIKKVLDVLKNLEEPYKLREIHDLLKEELAYHKIRLSLAWYYKNRKT